jgi:hypothetical protein
MQTHRNVHQFVQLLTPSLLSGPLTVGLPIAGMLMAIVFSRIHDTTGFDWLTGTPRALMATSDGYQAITAWLNNSSFVSSLSVLVFWALVGAAVYITTLQCIKALGAGVELKREMGYMHADKSAILRNAGLRLVIRVGVAFGVYGLLGWIARQAIPAVLAAASDVAASAGSRTASQAAVATSLLIAGLIILTTLLRLFMFRTRLFCV